MLIGTPIEMLIGKGRAEGVYRDACRRKGGRLPECRQGAYRKRTGYV